MMAQTKLVRWLSCGLVVSLLVLMLPGAALASGNADEGTTVKVGGYQVSLGFSEAAKAGENPVHVQILDGMGMPVSGAQVEISAMPVEDTQQHQQAMQNGAPAMGGMPGMDAATATPAAAGMAGMSGMGKASTPAGAATLEPVASVETVTAALQPADMAGEYAGVILFPAAGHWMLNVHLSLNGQALDAGFPLDVAGNSAGMVILGSFAGLNVVLIGAAAVTKRKPVSA